jgi:hypothetical protein
MVSRVRMIDPDDKWFVDRLSDPTVSENDEASCLDVLEVLAPCRDILGHPPLDYALPTLASIISDRMRPRSLREKAAKVARLINPTFVATLTI